MDTGFWILLLGVVSGVGLSALFAGGACLWLCCSGSLLAGALGHWLAGSSTEELNLVGQEGAVYEDIDLTTLRRESIPWVSRDDGAEARHSAEFTRAVEDDW